MNTLDQYRVVLEVLIQMRHCLDNDTNYTTVLGKPFNLIRQNAICSHVFLHSPCNSGIHSQFLNPVFEKLGLDTYYPVERQLTSTGYAAELLFWKQRNMYDMDSEPGKVRYKLLTQLIQYFEKEIACIV